MPVNFMTDLKDLKDYSYVPQIPLDALFKNMGYKQAKYDQNTQQLKRTMDALWDIPAYGPDIQKKQEIINQVNSELGKFAKADLTDPNVVNQIQGFIGQVSSNPDLIAIGVRGTKYRSDINTLKELQAKGKSVPLEFQPSIRAADKYYSGNVYDPEVRFRGEVQIAPDIESKFKNILEALPEKVDVYTDASGMQHTTKSKDYSRLQPTLEEALRIDPELANYSRTMFDARNEGVNWDQEGQIMLDNDIAELNKDLAAARILAATGPSEDVRNQALKTYGSLRERISQAEKVRNAGFSGTQLKELYHSQYNKDLVSNWAATHSYFNTTDLSLNERKKLEIMFNQDMEKLREEYRLKNELEETKAEVKTKNLLGGEPNRILKEFYDLTETEGNIPASSIVKDDKGSSKKFSPKEISETFKTSSMVGDSKDWVQYADDINAINAYDGKVAYTIDPTTDALTTSIQGPNVAVDEKGRKLQFINPKTHQVGYVEETANGRNFKIINYENLSAKMVEKAKKYQLETFTYPSTRAEYSGAVTKTAPSGTSSTPAIPSKPAEKPGFISYYIPGVASPYQIPADSAASFLRDNPTAVKY